MTEPKPKMPRGRQIFMTAIAFAFEILQTICALLVVFAPVLICYFAKYWVQTQWVSSETAGDLACWAAGVGLAASYVTPVGAGIALLGYALSACVYLLFLIVFWFWYWLIGVNFFDKLGSRIWIIGSTTALELLPFSNVLPWSTASVWLIGQTVRKEDREERQKYEEWLAAKQPPAQAAPPQPANDNAPETGEERQAA